MRRLVLVPALLLTLSACSRSTAGAPAPAPGTVEVSVTNNNALPMELYASGSGINHRMGTVHPGMGGHFMIPQNLVGNGSVTFEARPSGGGRPFRSGEVMLASGALVRFVIAPQLFNSTVTRQ